MPFSDSQLEIWSRLGSITQSASTYASMKGTLEDDKSPYYSHSFDTFLQGSYGNDTNIWADSDVDVIIRLTSSFHHNIRELGQADQDAFNRDLSDATYGLTEFKKEVLSWLIQKYGKESVTAGSKAIAVKGNGTRRDSDVLPTVQYRKYSRYKGSADNIYVEGICFRNSDGDLIINYPKQHSENTTAKHQATNGWYKPTVRLFKNMRNRMIEDGMIEDSLAPSYFLEGLIYNVPVDRFGGSESANFVDVYNWLINVDQSKFVCANEQYYLFHPTSLVTWRKERCEEFLTQLGNFWSQVRLAA
jgi:hypothetical protein